MKRITIKFALVLAMLSFISIESKAMSVYTEPFSIGPGQVVTLKFFVAEAPADIETFDFNFNLPEGVHAVGVDLSDQTSAQTVTFTLNSAAAGFTTSNSSMAYKGDRPDNMGGQYYLAVMGATSGAFKGKALTSEGDWAFSIDVVCDEGTTPNDNAEVTILDYSYFETSTGEGLDSSEGLEIVNSTVKVSDKFTATISGSGYTTICSTADLDFSGVEGLTAYVVSKADGSKATLAKIENAPAGTGVILKGTAGETVEIPTGSATAPADNKLVGVTKVTPLTGDGSQFFLVGGKFVKAAEVSTVPAGKAYVVASASAKEFDVLDIVFDDDEATAIKNVENEQFEGVVYNLNGVRVDNPTKGVYVKNGKKFVVK